MKIFLSFVLFLYLCCISFVANAQKREHVWMFTERRGLDFNGGSPVFVEGSMWGNYAEGCASVCDATGQLLFYTNGNLVWNRHHNLMPNGNELISPIFLYGTNSTTQGAVIIPSRDKDNIYYLFSLECNLKAKAGIPYHVADADRGGHVVANSGAGVSRWGLYYSVVDTDLDNGNGDIAPGQRSILIDTNLSEKMAAVAGEHCNAWLMVRSNYVINEYKAFEITDAGISAAPVVSNPGQGPVFSQDSCMGAMRFSPDRKRVASANACYGAIGNLEICDFDPASGTVSNWIQLDDIRYYSLCFSPDGSKLYAAASGALNSNLYQFDLSLLPNVTAVMNSKTQILSVQSMPYGITHWSQFEVKTGPDGKVYVGEARGVYLHVINDPNQPGLLCQPATVNLPVPPGWGLTYTAPVMFSCFPNDVVVYPSDTLHHQHAIILCDADSVVLTTDPGALEYFWDDGSTGSSRTVYVSGNYTVRYLYECRPPRIDTIIVRFQHKPVPGPDGYSCPERADGVLWMLPSDTTTYSYNMDGWRRWYPS